MFSMIDILLIILIAAALIGAVITMKKHPSRCCGDCSKCKDKNRC